jgi:2,4-dienoyl-CoA reductase-like NADH-dependent reductase (Old Yellow Enzyme family)
MNGSTTDPLLQPLKVGHITLKNRIMSTSHACGLDKDGYPQEAYQAYHEEKAKGRAGTDHVRRFVQRGTGQSQHVPPAAPGQ